MDADDMLEEFGMLGENVFSQEKLVISDGWPNLRRYKKDLRKMVKRHGGDADKPMLDGQPGMPLV